MHVQDEKDIMLSPWVIISMILQRGGQLFLLFGSMEECVMWILFLS